MRTRKRQEKAVPLTYRGHRREARQDAAAAPAAAAIAAAIAVQGCKLFGSGFLYSEATRWAETSPSQMVGPAQEIQR